MLIEFIADETQLIFEVDEKSCDMRLKCKFEKRHYGELIETLFNKRMSRGMKPKQLLMIPNYGVASRKESMEFHRTLPVFVSAKRIIFLLLPTDDKSKWPQLVPKKI